MIPKLLSIAGFDGSGGAGIQADLKVFSAFGCYGMSVLTALPIQNTTGVKSCYNIPLKSIEEQLDAIFSDIMPDAIKIGMLFNDDIVNLVADFLSAYKDKIPIVLDPVMVAKSGDNLLLPSAVNTLKKKLIPLVTVITPNIPEAKEITGISVNNTEDMQMVAKIILDLGAKSVFLKGGHTKNDNIAQDLLLEQHSIETQWFNSPRIKTKNSHGTGCTLSAAIASCLGQKKSLLDSCKIAKKYIYNAIKAFSAEEIGKGYGPVHHFYHLWPELEKFYKEEDNGEYIWIS
jgi:hydroxymethylpyrimidine/phosphomethylpyrimidine kinase